MELRRALIFISTIALALNLTAAVYADQSGSNSDHGNGNNFSYVGFRSHGAPVATLGNQGSDNQGSDNQGSDNQGSDNGSAGNNGSQSDAAPTADPSTLDQSWLQGMAQNFKNSTPKGFYSPVGSPAKVPISCHYSCTTLTGTIAFIPVWVGNWASSDVANWNNVLGNIVSSLGSGTANSVAVPGHVFNTDTLYYTSQGLTPPSLQWVSNTSITAPTATTVSDADVATYIGSFIAANPGIVPTGATPVYIYIGANSTLLTSGFGTTYCGWHSYGNLASGGTSIPFIAFQDFTSVYNSTCAAQVNSPNGSASLDAMASIMVHEVDETLTDPFFSGWWDSKGQESADKCQRTYGTLSTVGAAKYNVQLGALKYLIQQNWLENNIVTSTGTSSGLACSVTG